MLRLPLRIDLISVPSSAMPTSSDSSFSYSKRARPIVERLLEAARLFLLAWRRVYSWFTSAPFDTKVPAAVASIVPSRSDTVASR